MRYEHPAILPGNMVSALIDDDKSVLRLKATIPRQRSWKEVEPFLTRSSTGELRWLNPVTSDEIAPKWRQGDILWVRETWAAVRETAYTCGDGEVDEILETITGPPSRMAGNERVEYAADGPQDGPWRPSIHMPRWASRFDLTVTGVRLEEVGEVTEEEARLEGFDNLSEFRQDWIKRYASWSDHDLAWRIQFTSSGDKSRQNNHQPCIPKDSK